MLRPILLFLWVVLPPLTSGIWEGLRGSVLALLLAWHLDRWDNSVTHSMVPPSPLSQTQESLGLLGKPPRKEVPLSFYPPSSLLQWGVGTGKDEKKSGTNPPKFLSQIMDNMK